MADFGIMATLHALNRPSTAPGTIRLRFCQVALGLLRAGGGRGRRDAVGPAAPRRHRRLPLQFFGGLARYLGDVQSDVLLLAAALEGDGDMIGSLDGIEYILTTLWIIQGRGR